jgi:hypothetical protein
MKGQELFVPLNQSSTGICVWHKIEGLYRRRVEDMENMTLVCFDHVLFNHQLGVFHRFFWPSDDPSSGVIRYYLIGTIPETFLKMSSP